jgi:hypothetical protein
MSKASYKSNREFDFTEENELAALKIVGCIIMIVIAIAIYIYYI